MNNTSKLLIKDYLPIAKPSLDTTHQPKRRIKADRKKQRPKGEETKISRTKIRPHLKKSKQSECPTTASSISEPVPDKSKQLPLLFIDIHLDDKDVHRLAIHEGDSPRSLAISFCAKFSKLSLLTSRHRQRNEGQACRANQIANGQPAD